ncbi:nucleic-acid-binding protein from transposon X-element [Trichonephila clavipes]|nr:nucleic-acid-binding protein from transposon X-element [Trichonephila clavipes]
MPSDMPPQQIVEALQDLGITLNDCKVMTNRKTGLPMPLFLLSLPRNETNRDIYNITEICYMKIVVEPLKPRNGPAQCFRCQGFFHSSRFCTRNPKCVKCGKPHLTRDCKKTPDTDATCCHCQGNHPANYSGCPMNPLNKPPPPPKVNAWQEREKKRREEQEAKRIQALAASTTTVPNSSIPQPAEPPTRPTETRTSPQQQTPPPQPPTTQPPQDSSLLGTLKELQDPQVVELLTTMKKIVAIAKQEKTQGEKALELCHLLEHNSIKIHTDAVETAAIEIIGPNLKFTICSIYKPPSASTPNFIQDLKKIFRNRNQCLVGRGLKAKPRSWNPHSPQHCSRKRPFKFARNNSLVISAPSDPTIIPAQQNRQPAIIDLGLSRGLNNITVESRYDLTSDHNPVHFVVHFNFNNSHIPNCKSITNWNKYQDILSTTIAGNPPINNTEDIEHAIENFNLNIHTAINQSSKFLPAKQAFTLVPLPIRLKIREKNRLRKFWQETRYPPAKTEMNRLTREIRKEIILIKRRNWDDALVESGGSPNNIHKFIARMNRKPVSYPPLLGSQGLVFGTREKADLFVDTLEDSFQENRTPYDNDHIDEVDRVVRRFPSPTLRLHPLTSPNEISEIIKSSTARKPRDRTKFLTDRTSSSKNLKQPSPEQAKSKPDARKDPSLAPSSITSTLKTSHLARCRNMPFRRRRSDYKTSRHTQEIRASLQTYLMKLKKWLKLWRISINTTKSRAIIFKNPLQKQATATPPIRKLNQLDSHFLLTSNRSALFHTTGSTTTERPSIKTDSPLLYEMTSLLRTSASPPMSPHQSSCSNHTAKESTAPREPQRTLKTLYYFTQDSKRTHD